MNVRLTRAATALLIVASVGIAAAQTPAPVAATAPTSRVTPVVAPAGPPAPASMVDTGCRTRRDRRTEIERDSGCRAGRRRPADAPASGGPCPGDDATAGWRTWRPGTGSVNANSAGSHAARSLRTNRSGARW